jgi:pimeloyl-ACP methyl ester carboxylesterase
MPEIIFADLRINYSLTGKGEPLILFPDNILASGAYKKEIALLSEQFQVLAFDYPGTGKSSRDKLYMDEREYDYWGFWADLACHLLLELKIDTCYAMGIGGGALTALHFAGKQAPQHQIIVEGLIADSFRADMDSRTLHRWLDVREHFYVRNQKMLQEIHDDDWREVVDYDTSVLRRLADRGGYQIPNSFMNAIACPVMLTGHMEDPFLPNLADEYARISGLIPNCSMFLSSKQNHPYIERPFMKSDPDTFFGVLELFLGMLEKNK